MSMRSWKKEYYPTPSKKVKGEREAIEHSLQKWEGLTPENLEKHGVCLESNNVLRYNNTLFNIDADSCALCNLYLDEWIDSCTTCPLFLKGDGCLESNRTNSYTVFYDTGNAQPMIDSLRSLLVV